MLRMSGNGGLAPWGLKPPGLLNQQKLRHEDKSPETNILGSESEEDGNGINIDVKSRRSNQVLKMHFSH